MDKHIFRSEVKKELFLRNWSYADLGEATGYAGGTIRVMMHDDTRLSPKAMRKIAEVLHIKLIE